MSKRIDDKTFEKLVQDVKSLRSVYTDAKIATLMNTNPGNFSSRINGTKRPGQDFIDAFYQALGVKLKEIGQVKAENGNEAGYEWRDDQWGLPDQVIHVLNGMDQRLQRLEESIRRIELKLGYINEKLNKRENSLSATPKKR